MIISRTGEILQFFLITDVIIVKDGDFSICLEYNDTQKAQFARMRELKKNLEESDYKALKFADGALSEEEYAPIRAERQIWRDEINEIEAVFTVPIITREEMDHAEAAALENAKSKFILM